MRRRPGQVAVLFLILFPVVWFVVLLPFSYAWDAAARAVVQAGTQAAALGCASQATVTRKVDARGYVYSSSVAVRPNAGPAAAAAWWRQSMLQGGVSGLYVARWQVSVSGSVCVVQVAVNITPPAGSLFSAFEHLAAGVAAKAIVPA